MTAVAAASPLARIADTLRSLGTLNGLLYLASRALEGASGGRARIVKYLLVAQPVAVGAALRPDANTRIRDCAAGDPLEADFPRPPRVIAARHAAGAQCLVATVKERFAGFLWLQRNRYEEDEVRCSYVLADPASCVWDFDVYVEPAFRNGRTMARLWQAANERLLAEGVRWSCSRISTFNAASLAAHRRLGAQPIGNALFVVIGPLQLALLSGAPFVHLSLTPSQRPRLALRPPA